MIRRIRQGLLAEGVAVSIAKLCTWFGIPRRTVCYKPVKAAPKVDPRFSEPIRKIPLTHAAHVLPGSGSRRSRPLAIGPWPGSWASTRTPCSGYSRLRAGRCASVPWACGPASRLCRRLQLRRTTGVVGANAPLGSAGFVSKRGAQIQTLDASLSNIARSILLSLSPAALVSPS